MEALPEVEGFTIDKDMMAIIPFGSEKGAEMLEAISAWIEEFQRVVDGL